MLNPFYGITLKFIFLLFFLVGASAQATQIVIVNMDGAGEGFNDNTPASPVGGNTGTTIGAQRLQVFEHAASMWELIVDSKVTIRVEAKFDPLTCTATSAVLGSAGTKTVHRDFTKAPVSNTYYAAALANSLAGRDLSSSADIAATFNSDIDNNDACLNNTNWYYGLDGVRPGGTYEMLSVVLHEIGHGLGFQTFVDLTTGEKFLGKNDIFMLNLEDHSSGLLWSEMVINNGDSQRLASIINTTNLHWVGNKVMSRADNFSAGVNQNSQHVEMYAPDPLRSGSSVSHFSKDVSPNELMEPFDTGPKQSVGLAMELFQDIGWKIFNNAPLVTIDVPVNNINYSISDSIILQGSASDTEDGDLSNNIEWSSSIDGYLGTASVLSSVVLSEGMHTITASISDSGNLIDTNKIQLTVINTPPVITEGASTAVDMDEDSSPITFSLSLNATDVDGGVLTWSIGSAALNGTASVAGTGASKVINYAPDVNFNGTDSFIVVVTDEYALSDSITVNVNISAQADAPVISEGASIMANMSEDSSPIAFSLILNASDVENDALSWSVDSAATDGLAIVTGSGTSKSIAYAPNANYNGADNFVVKVSDATGLADTITVSVNISAQNDDPVLNILAPADSSSFIETDVISFQASSSDIEDGDISSNVQWSSSKDGLLGVGNVATILSAGSHSITASVTDSSSATVNEMISVEVQAVAVITADGDINDDGLVNVADFLLATQHINQLRVLTAAEIARGDLYPDGAPDGELDLSDLILLQKIIHDLP